MIEAMETRAGDLAIGTSGGAPGGGRGHCEQGHTYRGTQLPQGVGSRCVVFEVLGI